MNGVSDAQQILSASFTPGDCISTVWLEGQLQAMTWITSKLLWEKGGK